MTPLKQSLWIVSAVCCANLLAIQVHVWAWELRQQRRKILCAFGYVSLSIITFCLYSWWREAGVDWVDPVTDNALRSEQHRTIGFIVGGLGAGTLILGLAHSRQISSRWRDAAIALYGEIFVAIFAACLLLYLWMELFSPRNWNITFIDQEKWIIWFAWSYGLSLLGLALMRPFLVRICAQFLQITHNWFRLN
jgi:hypothetical protein